MITCRLLGHNFFLSLIAKNEAKLFCTRCRTNFPTIYYPRSIREFEEVLELVKKIKYMFGNPSLKLYKEQKLSIDAVGIDSLNALAKKFYPDLNLRFAPCVYDGTLHLNACLTMADDVIFKSGNVSESVFKIVVNAGLHRMIDTLQNVTVNE